MAAKPQTSAELARALVELREAAGLSGSAAAEAAGVPRTRLSRLEHGRFTPRPAEIEALAGIYRAPAATRRAMLAVVEKMAGAPVPRRQILYRGGSARMQQRVAEAEASSTLIRVFQLAVVPGLLQTAEYARVVMAGGGKVNGRFLDEAVATRVGRQSALDSPRRFVLMMSEGALYWTVGSDEIMAGQMDRLITEATARPNVRVGVVPREVPVTFVPGHGLSAYDRRTVIIGLWDGTEFVGDDDRVQLFDELLKLAERAAVFGEAAAAVFRRAGDWYRS